MTLCKNWILYFLCTDSDFSMVSLTFLGASNFTPSIVVQDSVAELSEGFIIYLEVDRANTDPRDLSRIQFLNRHILAVIEDDDGESSSACVPTALI